MITVPENISRALLAPERYIQARLSLYIGDTIVDLTEETISFDTLETITSTTQKPYGAITYNELHIELDNLAKNFTLTNSSSPYFQKLKAKMKVILEYIVFPDLTDMSNSYTIPGGTFYTDTWKGDIGENTATVDCYDILQLYGEQPLIPFKIQRNVPAKKAFEFLFKLYGIPSNLYTIDSSLSVSLDFFRPIGDTLTECLESIALACCANVYADRFGRIVVKSILRKKTSGITLSEDAVIFNIKAPSSSREAYAYISMTYFENTEQTQEVIYKETGRDIPSGIVKLSGLVSKIDPLVDVVGVAITGKNVTIIDRTFTSSTVDIIIENKLKTNQQIDLRIFGTGLQVNQSTLTSECEPDDSSNTLQINLEQCISMQEAQKNINLLKKLFAGGTVQQEVELRALPFLELGDKVTIYSPISRLNQDFYVSEISNVFDGALTGTMKLSAAEYKPKPYTWIAPGLYIKRKEDES